MIIQERHSAPRDGKRLRDVPHSPAPEECVERGECLLLRKVAAGAEHDDGKHQLVEHAHLHLVAHRGDAVLRRCHCGCGRPVD
jgi:hypothetical protein